MALQRKLLPTGNLFQVAAQYLGDATQWYLIAECNNMTDPFFNGPIWITIPASDPGGGNGGILGE